MFRAAFCVAAGLAAFAATARADDVASAISNAGAAHGRGDEVRALSSLQSAEDSVAAQLTTQIEGLIPPAPKGWDAAQPDEPPLDEAGGGFTLSRGYQSGNASLTVLVVIDNPAVAAAAMLFQPNNPETSQPNWSRVKLGDNVALLRYDETMQEGEILMVLGGRALLEIDGDGISSRGLLLDMAKGWNLDGFQRLLSP